MLFLNGKAREKAKEDFSPHFLQVRDNLEKKLKNVGEAESFRTFALPILIQITKRGYFTIF